jgi:nanoRNase/pAp phosphatase (c-di-AMP/oligoRNAs hydrolase)
MQKNIESLSNEVNSLNNNGVGNKKENKEKNISLVATNPLSGKTQEFFKILEESSGNSILAVIKGHPDPDSIASSLAFKYLASHYNIETDIVYFDKISHQENKALVKTLEIEMIQYVKDFDFSKYKYIVFNDTPSTDLPVDISEDIEILGLIDHHKNNGTSKALFTDIRENLGSTCTIYTRYIKDGQFPFEIGSKEHTRLATAMLYAIRSDTDNLLLAKEEDLISAAYLSSFADKELLTIISEQSISSKSMDILQYALQNKQISSNFLIAGVKYVREEDRDGIAQAADYLLKREGIETVVVYGIVGGNVIDGSLRTMSRTLDPDKWLKEVFGTNSEGKFYAGGRHDKGGFQIPLGIFKFSPDGDMLWNVVQETILSRIFEQIGVEPSKKSV